MPYTKSHLRVTNPGFGYFYTVDEFYTVMIDYLTKQALPKNLDGFTKEVLKEEIYNEMFGIVNLDDPFNPLASISYTNADTLGDLSSVADLINEFRSNDIHNVFGISLTEFFEMPAHVGRLLISKAKNEKQMEREIQDEAKREAEKMEKEARKNL